MVILALHFAASASVTLEYNNNDDDDDDDDDDDNNNNYYYYLNVR